MKILLIAVLTTYIGCQNFNSNTFDEQKYGKSNLTGSAEFRSAYPVLQSRCMNCHHHSQWSGYINETEWLTRGLVVQSNNPGDSQIINRTINYGAAESNMPEGGQALPLNEYEALLDWVESL